MFVNRERELSFLEQRYATGQAELVVLYGRRRVGKTELLRAFCQGKKHIFFVADLGTEESQLADFTRQVGAYLAGDPDLLPPFGSWAAAFNFLAAQTHERLVVVLDELTYLIEVNRAFPSALQKLWDTHLKDTGIMLVLCGSYVGVIEQSVLAYRSPLYGRRTGQWRLQPFTFWEAPQMLPGIAPEALVPIYAILGGVPAYLRQYDPDLTLAENIQRKILTPGAYLYDEPRFLLLQELRDPSRYFALLEAIAGGRTRSNEIAQTSGVAVTSLAFYLRTLQEMGLIERTVPATELLPDKSKLGLYHVADPYFRFWFRFVYPNRSLLERGETTLTLRKIMAEIDQFTGPAFESICREVVWRLHGAGELGFTPRAVGRWWNRQEEIDVMAVGEDDLLVGECKWSTKPVGENILDELMRKATLLKTSGDPKRVHYALFARAGFTPALRDRASAQGVRLVALDDLMRQRQTTVGDD
ncbi:MAG: ATP-binding protein [Caldilineales bacterium]|nr:ATP-binding protein [Caldilineales bacterium]MCW5858482.1 ATP-binding protein [Caldilineales bacterium]